jgi:predicted metal-dependent HD superfamily phosphohydrolase
MDEFDAIMAEFESTMTAFEEAFAAYEAEMREYHDIVGTTATDDTYDRAMSAYRGDEVTVQAGAD